MNTLYFCGRTQKKCLCQSNKIAMLLQARQFNSTEVISLIKKYPKKVKIVLRMKHLVYIFHLFKSIYIQ